MNRPKGNSRAGRRSPGRYARCAADGAACLRDEGLSMIPPEQHERSGMPLWAVIAALLSAGLGCLLFLAGFPLVFAWELRWLPQILEWSGIAALAAVPLWLVAGLWAARKRSDG